MHTHTAAIPIVGQLSRRVLSGSRGEIVDKAEGGADALRGGPAQPGADLVGRKLVGRQVAGIVIGQAKEVSGKVDSAGDTAGPQALYFRIVVGPEVNRITPSRGKAQPGGDRRHLSGAIQVSKSRQRVGGKQHVSSSGDKSAAEGRIEENLLPDAQGQDLAGCPASVRGGAASKEAIVEDILNLIGVAEDVLLIKEYGFSEFIDPGDVAVGDRRLNEMLQAMPPHLKDPLQPRTSPIQFQIEGRAGQIAGSHSGGALGIQPVGIKGLSPTDSGGQTDSTPPDEGDREPGMEIEALDHTRCRKPSVRAAHAFHGGVVGKVDRPLLYPAPVAVQIETGKRPARDPPFPGKNSRATFPENVETVARKVSGQKARGDLVGPGNGVETVSIHLSKLLGADDIHVGRCPESIVPPGLRLDLCVLAAEAHPIQGKVAHGGNGAVLVGPGFEIQSATRPALGIIIRSRQQVGAAAQGQKKSSADGASTA